MIFVDLLSGKSKVKNIVHHLQDKKGVLAIKEKDQKGFMVQQETLRKVAA